MQLPSSLLQNYTAPVQAKGVKIASSVSVAVTATVASGQYTIHNTRLLPVSKLSTTYFVGKPHSDINLVSLKRSKFNITYLENGTTIFASGILEPFDSYILRNSSFIGPGVVVISSSEPIAAYLYSSDGYVYQETPSKTAGYKFIVPRAIDYFRAAKFRVSALHDNTYVKTTVGSETVIMKLNKGNFIESELKTTVILSSSQPIVVMMNVGMYSVSNNWLYLPDISQFAHEYSIQGSPVNAYVTLITPSSYEKQIVFSETFVPEWLKTERVILDGISYFVATTKLSGASSHEISVADIGGQFGGFFALEYGDFNLRLYPLSRECH